MVGVLQADGVQATCSYASMPVLEQATTTEGCTVMVAYGSTLTTVTSVSYETSTVYLSATDATGQQVGVPVAAFEESWAASQYTMIESTQTVAEYYQAQAITTTPPTGDSVAQQATTGPWALLPISPTTQS